ncbi:MAG TPA: phosphopantetheine-binding protein [Stellaceae bacterium]
MTLETDEAVMRVFSEVLGKAHISPADDFFAIGGSSLSAAVATTKLEQLLGIDISLRLLMEHPVIGTFSDALAELRHTAGGNTDAR